MFISKLGLEYLLLDLCSVFFPVFYYQLDRSLLDITDRFVYEQVFYGNTFADTAFYPVFVAFNKLLFFVSGGDYVFYSLTIAVILYWSSVRVFVLNIFSDSNRRAFYMPLMFVLVLCSFYSIKAAFALKKLGLALALLNISLISSNTVLSLLLKISALGVHPQILPLVFLPRRPLHYKSFVSLFRSFHLFSKPRIFRQLKALIRPSTISISIPIAIVFLGILSAVREYGNLYELINESLSLKLSSYTSGRSLFDDILIPAVLSLFFFLYLFLKNNVPFASYTFSLALYIFMLSAFGTSRLILLFPYYLYPFRNTLTAKLALLSFYLYAFYRSILAWLDFVPFGG